MMKNFVLLTLLLLLLPLLCSCISDNEEQAWSLQPGDPLPEFAVELNGIMISTDMLRGSKAVIVFFNTGCSDCRDALPKIQDAYDLAMSSGENVRYICISREEGEDAISRYWQENGLTLPYSAQTGRTVYNMFADSGIPRVYIANENLIIEKVYE